MATSGQEGKARTYDDILLDGMIATEVQNAFQDELPRLAREMTRRVFEKIRKRVTMKDVGELVSTEEGEPSAKKGKIYHLSKSEEEEDIRATLSKKRKCYRCRKGDHDASDCIFGDKVCYYCNRMGHSYDDCVERMVTKTEITTDPYYDPWVFERVQYK